MHPQDPPPIILSTDRQRQAPTDFPHRVFDGCMKAAEEATKEAKAAGMHVQGDETPQFRFALALRSCFSVLAKPVGKRRANDLAVWFSLAWLGRELQTSFSKAARDVLDGSITGDDAQDLLQRRVYTPFREMASLAYQRAARPLRREVGEPPRLDDPHEGVLKLQDWLHEATEAAEEQARKSIRDKTLLEEYAQLKELKAHVAKMMEHLGRARQEKRLEPEPKTEEAYLSASELATKYGVPPEKRDALRKRLERLRRRSDDYREVQNPRRNEPRFLYRVGAVLPLIEDLRAQK